MLLGLLFSLFLFPVSFAQAQPPAKASLREAIYFGPAGPVRIRLHVSIDGKPAEAAWNEAVEALFAHRDADGDGFLSAAERTPFVQQGRVPRELEVFSTEGRPPLQPLQLDFGRKDDKVSRAAFAEAMKTAARGPIATRVVPVGADSPQLSAALFRHLDATKDGRLSADELKAARERLAFLDLDEDEFITTAELLGRSVNPNAGRVRPVFPGMQQRPEPAESSADLVFLTADGPQGVKQLLAARGKPKATSLKAAEFGADAKAFAALDQDGNGTLDTTELTAWLQKPPALELTVSFDAAGGKLAALSAGSPPEKNGAVAAALPGGRFRFEPPAGAPLKEWKAAADQLRAQFREQAGWLGLVWRNSVANQPAALACFDLADRRAGGVVGMADIEAALKAAAPVANCRVEVAFIDQGDGLFELLDRNRDGRLSPRELAEAVAVLKPFAATGRGTIGPRDLVRQFQVRVGVDPLPIGVLLQPTQPASGDEPGPPAAAPAWFAKMDRNGDGDVSLREFVGPIGLFRKLDRDGDGLLSRTEAAEK